MRNNKLYKEIAIIVCFALAALSIHVIMWMYVTKKYINDNSDFVKERLVGTVFIDDENEDQCVVITNSNIIKLDYSIASKIKSVIGISGDWLVNDIRFDLKVNNGEEVLDISGIMRLRYYGEDGRRWICQGLAADDYKVIRVDTYVLKINGR
jgi:hypothetical protein